MPVMMHHYRSEQLVALQRFDGFGLGLIEQPNPQNPKTGHLRSGSEPGISGAGVAVGQHQRSAS